MTYSRVLRLIRYLFFTGLVLVFSASILKAETMKGKFSLPFDADWAGVFLPAGEYTFVIDSTGQKPIELRNTADGKTIIRLIAYAEKLDTPAKSQLLIVHGAQESMVHILYLASVKTAFHFIVPKQYEVTSRIIASSSGPAGIDHIPVVTSGN